VGNRLPDGKHRTPLGKTSPEVSIFVEAFAQSVQTFGDLFTGESRHLRCAQIDFDAGDDPFTDENVNKRRTVFLLLANRLVVQDRAADALAKTGRRH
jgi:hypothetical protein